MSGRPSEPGGVVVRHACAKVNLALAVSAPSREPGARQGWHEIASWFAPAALFDTLTLTRLDDDALSAYAIDWAREGSPFGGAPCPTRIDWPITRDLTVRAHLLLERETGRPLPLRLRVEKRIPVGGGLGGGSSDAAAMLEGVNELFALGLSTERLRELSRELGSDVAYFLREAGGGAGSEGAETRLARPAFVSGFGDVIERTAALTGPAALALIFPGFGCATPAVYGAFDAIDARLLRPSASFEERASAAWALAERGSLDERSSRELFNDLAPAAEMVEPRLRDLREAVRRATQCEPHVTGSGSTLFVVARDAEHAAWVAQRAGEETGVRTGVAALGQEMPVR